MVFVADMGKAIHFYTSVLGFEIGVQMEGYAYLVRDAIAIRLIQSGESGTPNQQSCYICVEMIDALYDEMKPRLDTLPVGRVRAPFDQPYGQREFHVSDEDGLLLFFGETNQNT